jgi:hypothetical protein
MKPSPAQRQMAVRNRELIAERCGWPDGILPTCVELERQHPGWDVGWLPENRIKGFEREAGFVATRLGATLEDSDELRPGRPHQQPRVFAADPVGLVAKMAAMEERIAAAVEADRRQWRVMRGL